MAIKPSKETRNALVDVVLDTAGFNATQKGLAKKALDLAMGGQIDPIQAERGRLALIQPCYRYCFECYGEIPRRGYTVGVQYRSILSKGSSDRLPRSKEGSSVGNHDRCLERG